MNGIFWEGDFDKYFLGHQFEEIFKSRIYAPYLENKVAATVVDIGGNIGIFSLYAAKYAKQVYCVEPSQRHIAILNYMFQFNKLTNVKLIPKAIFTENTTLPFGGPVNNTTMRSLHTATWQDGKPDEQVETLTLDKLFDDEKIKHCDLLKLDIEGTEIEIFSGIGFKKVADKIDTIVTERHSWTGRNPRQLDDALINNGFKVLKIENDADIIVATRL